MQTLFAERTDWHVPWLERVLPLVVQVARANPDRTLFTRFAPPENLEEATGSWRRYYRRWHHITREQLNPRLIELVPPVASLAPPAVVSIKCTTRRSRSLHLGGPLKEQATDCLVITGAETDVCVLAV